MRFLSLFSGIEAASAAWLPLGWECVGFAEIDKFPAAVLAHHHPSVPNLGDVSKVTREQIESLSPIDLVVGGFPCQDLSIAGKRAGLEDKDGRKTRSGLFFDAMRIVEWAGPRWVVIENVPGLFSSKGGGDFAAVVGELAGADFDVPDDGWSNAGVAAGARGLVEWATLDAQFFGLAQRRARVFLVRDSGNWASRPPVLLEPESLSGHPAPRRETGQEPAGGTLRSTDGGSDVCHAEAGHLIPETVGALTSACGPNAHGGSGLATDNGADAGHIIADTLRGFARAEHQAVAYGGNNTAGPIDVATAVRAKGGSGHGDFESETFIAHALRADGFDASEDGTVRGTPLLPVAFSCKDHGADAGEISPKLRAMGHGDSHANAGGQVAVAFDWRAGGDTACGTSLEGCPPVRTSDTIAVAIQAGALRENPNSGPDGVGVQDDIAYTMEACAEVQAVAFDTAQITSRANGTRAEPGLPTSTLAKQIRMHVATTMQVRRLTPRECERLQGFPDDYTLIQYRGKPAADGPRYKALGNSFAVPVVRWIGQRIASVESFNEAN